MSYSTFLVFISNKSEPSRATRLWPSETVPNIDIIQHLLNSSPQDLEPASVGKKFAEHVSQNEEGHMTWSEGLAVTHGLGETGSVIWAM